MRSVWIAALGLLAVMQESRADTRDAASLSATRIQATPGAPRPSEAITSPARTIATPATSPARRMTKRELRAQKRARDAQAKAEKRAALVRLVDDPALGRADVVRVHDTSTHDMVAFTFDDGPHPDTTPQVLKALAKYDVPGAFFVVTMQFRGGHGPAARALVTKAAAAGHLIGSHTVHHGNLLSATIDQIEAEVATSVDDLAGLLGRPIALFRAPYGRLSRAGQKLVREIGMTEVGWSIDPRDWESPHRGWTHDEAVRVRKAVTETIARERGGIVLMHDSKPLTASVLGGVLDDLEVMNCRRIAQGKRPIVPVSLHYFLRDGGAPRAIPPTVAERTAAYREKLTSRCESRRRPRGRRS